GRIVPRDVIKIIDPTVGEEKERKKSIFQEIVQKAARSVRSGKSVIKVRGVDDLLVRFAKCCTPVQGEPIIGFITRGRGITIHRKSCPKILEIDKERVIDVEWEKGTKAERITRIKVETTDTSGLLAKMSKIFAENGSNVLSADIKTNEQKRAVCIFDVTISDISQLNKIISALKKISGIYNVTRLGLVEKEDDK
ncbi:MAG: ACT domain-containing protein, partial [Pseudomonadota bacterium]